MKSVGKTKNAQNKKPTHQRILWYEQVERKKEWGQHVIRMDAES